MELLEALVTQAAKKGALQLNVDFDETFKTIVGDICFQTLVKIHDILDNSDLSDFECIEKIVCTLEDIDFNGGCRHDFS